MYGETVPHVCVQIHPPSMKDEKPLTAKELLWRDAWPYAFTMILASIMLVLTVITIALEIANLTVDRSNDLSNTGSTGAGLWCSIFFFMAIVFMYLLGEYEAF